MWQHISLIAIARAFAEDAAGGNGHSPMLSLERKFGSLDKYNEPFPSRLATRSKLQSNRACQQSNQHEHGQVFDWHATDEHDKRTGGKEQHRCRKIAEGDQTTNHTGPNENRDQRILDVIYILLFL